MRRWEEITEKNLYKDRQNVLVHRKNGEGVGLNCYSSNGQQQTCAISHLNVLLLEFVFVFVFALVFA